MSLAAVALRWSQGSGYNGGISGRIVRDGITFLGSWGVLKKPRLAEDGAFCSTRAREGYRFIGQITWYHSVIDVYIYPTSIKPRCAASCSDPPPPYLQLRTSKHTRSTVVNLDRSRPQLLPCLALKTLAHTVCDTQDIFAPPLYNPPQNPRPTTPVTARIHLLTTLPLTPQPAESFQRPTPWDLLCGLFYSVTIVMLALTVIAFLLDRRCDLLPPSGFRGLVLPKLALMRTAACDWRAGAGSFGAGLLAVGLGVARGWVES